MRKFLYFPNILLGTIRLGGNPNDDTTAGEFGDVLLQGGKSYAPFAIANGGEMTIAEFLAANPITTLQLLLTLKLLTSHLVKLTQMEQIT